MRTHEVREGTSLVATVLNEERTLPAFLTRLAGQTVHPAEIVVVDGGSTDLSATLLRDWAPPCGCRIRVKVAPGAGISQGRNLAIQRAQNDRIVVTDAGTEPRLDWFARITAPWLSDPAAVIAGFFEPAGDAFWSRAIAAVTTPTLSEIDPDRFQPSSRSVAFPRAVWQAAGGYPEWLDYCEDLVFDVEMRKVRPSFTFASDAVVAWMGRPSLAHFAKQYYRYARGDGKAGLFRGRHLLRYGAYLLAIVAWPLSPWLVGVGTVGFAGYISRPLRRVWARRAMFSRTRAAAALAVVPVVVVVGDVAKMAGYPSGVVWRRRSRGGAR